MTEETPNPDQAEPNGESVPAEPVPTPEPTWQPTSQSAEDQAQATPPVETPPLETQWDPVEAQPAEGHPQEPAPSQPDPTPWESATESPYPSPQDDAALREHRAQRYGSPEQSAGGYPAPEATPPPAPPLPPEPAPMPAPAPAPVPVVTPIPAAPATQAFDPATMPMAQSPTTQMAPPPVETHYDAFEDLDDGPVSRAAAHWWSLLITLVFAPVAWYLFTDGGARVEWAISQGTPMAIASYIEFALGLLAVVIFMLAARWSSLGAFIIGSLVFALGLAYLIVPVEASTILANSTDQFGRLGQFGLNVHQHLGSSVESGRMVVYGLVMIMVGIVSHGARRQGRREERTKIALGE